MNLDGDFLGSFWLIFGSIGGRSSSNGVIVRCVGKDGMELISVGMVLPGLTDLGGVLGPGVDMV